MTNEIEHDLAAYGISITKDGKRISPMDFYKEPETTNETEQAELLPFDKLEWRSVPPVFPKKNDNFRVTYNAKGEFADQDGRVAHYTGNLWVFFEEGASYDWLVEQFTRAPDLSKLDSERSAIDVADVILQAIDEGSVRPYDYAKAAIAESEKRIAELEEALRLFDEAMRNGSIGPDAEKHKLRALNAAHKKAKLALAAKGE